MGSGKGKKLERTVAEIPASGGSVVKVEETLDGAVDLEPS